MNECRFFVAAVANIEERDPINYKETINSVNGNELTRAKDEDYRSLLVNDTWTVLHYRRDDIRSDLRKKKDSTGCRARFKARVVGKGNSQRFEEASSEIHVPVALQETFRTLLTVAGPQGLQLRHVIVVCKDRKAADGTTRKRTAVVFRHFLSG